MAERSSTPHHFHPDLFAALVEAVPVLNRTKADVVTFFRGCGVDAAVWSEIEEQFNLNPKFSKYHATRQVLGILNEGQDSTLGQRRQVIHRVTEWEDFSLCWPSDQLKAEGAVAKVRKMVDRKDSFTRMKQAKESEARSHREERDKELAALAAKQAALSDVRQQLGHLFSESDPHRRGKALERVLNDLFKTSGISLRDAFERKKLDSSTVLEQVDGSISLDNTIFLVEMKWWKKKLGTGEVSQHLVSLYSRAEAGGIFISSMGFTEPAVDLFRTALQTKVVVLVELREIVEALDRNYPIDQLLRKKVEAATLDKNPLTFPLENDVA